MHFLFPAFLTALLVLAIPVIVHLFRFRKYKTVRFTRVKFLKNIELETRNRNKLKHLVTMSARMAALACLVLAFAIPSCNGTGSGTGKTAVSIYIDNSFSMENGTDGSVLFESARERAREIIRSYGDAGRFQIVSNNPSGPALNFSSAQDALRFVDELRISPRFVPLPAILKRMREDLSSQAEEGVAYVISDMQAAFVRGTDEKTLRPENLRMIRLGKESRSNIYIDTAWPEQAFIIPGEKNKLIFRVVNGSSEKLEDMPVKLTSGSTLLGIGRVSAAPGESAQASIEFVPATAGVQTGMLSLEEPGISFDNKLHVDLSPAGLVQAEVRGNNPFVNSVLDAQRLFSKSPGADPKGTAVMIWTDFTSVSQADAANISAALNEGKTVILAPAEGADLNTTGEQFGFPKFRWVSGRYQVGRNGLSHPFFGRVFKKIPGEVQMPEIKSYISSEGAGGNGDIILSLENGDPLLLSFQQGKGRLYLFTSPFQAASGNLVKSSLFLPLLTNAMTYGMKSSVLYGIAGSGNMYPLRLKNAGGDAARMLKGEDAEVAAELTRRGDGMELYLGVQPEKAGIYRLGDKAAEVVAVNYDRRESDPAGPSSDWISLMQRQQGVEWLDAGNAGLARAAASPAGAHWKLFIWLAAAFFLLEVVALVFWDNFAVRRAAAT